MRGRLILASVMCVTLVACSSGSGSDQRSATRTTSVRTSTEGVPAFRHVFLIVGENTERPEITPSTMPFVTGTLAPNAASFTHYDAVTHHSLANYISMTSGQYTQCDQHDHDPSICHRNVGNLFSQLDGAGLTWRSWMESMPAPCTLENAGSDPTQYAVRHNPAVYYDPIEGANGTWSATSPSAGCLANDIPMGGAGVNDTSAFDAALTSGAVGDFNLVIPNICEDAHDDCGGKPTQLTQFDAFLAREVPKILASPAFGTDGLLIVTFDEGTTDIGGGGNVALYLEGPHVRPGVYDQAANHFSLLRMLEDGFRLYDYLGAASSAQPITNVWNELP